jgi:hypothetical protein
MLSIEDARKSMIKKCIILASVFFVILLGANLTCRF